MKRPIKRWLRVSRILVAIHLLFCFDINNRSIKMSELNLGNTLFERSNDQDEFMIYAHENKIDHKIAIDEHIERTCYVIIQHLKNVVCFQKI